MVSLVSFWRAVVREFGGAGGRGSAWVRCRDGERRTFGEIIGEIAAELAVMNARNRAVVNGSLCTVSGCAVIGKTRECCRRWRRAFHGAAKTITMQTQGPQTGANTPKSATHSRYSYHLCPLYVILLRYYRINVSGVTYQGR